MTSLTLLRHDLTDSAHALAVLRGDLASILGWIAHFQLDADCGRPPAATGLDMCRWQASHALAEIDHLQSALARVEDEIAAASDSQILGALVDRRAAIKQQINQR